MSRSASPSLKDYAPVSHHESEDDDDDDLHNDSSRDDGFIRVHTEPSQDSSSDEDDHDEDDDDKTQPTSNIHGHLSFDLDEEESELQRYRLPEQAGRTNNRSTVVIPKKLTIGALWQAYGEARLENRRRRAERLLANDSLQERTLICLSSWCDLTDRGLLLHIVLFLVWVTLCHFSKKPASLVMLGLCFFVARLTWRPLFWCLWGRRQEQKRQETMAIYDELHGSFETNGDNIV